MATPSLQVFTEHPKLFEHGCYQVTNGIVLAIQSMLHVQFTKIGIDINQKRIAF